MIFESIKAEANRQGKSIQKVEMEAGLGSGVISRWKKRDPRVGKLMAVAEVLGVTVDSLIKGQGGNDERK